MPAAEHAIAVGVAVGAIVLVGVAVGGIIPVVQQHAELALHDAKVLLRVPPLGQVVAVVEQYPLLPRGFALQKVEQVVKSGVGVGVAPAV